LTRRLLILALAVAPLGCGYSLAGRGSFLPAHIQTIGVPPFETMVPRSELIEELTRAVTREFIERGGFEITPTAEGADAVLKGIVTGLTEIPIAFDEDGRATRSLLTISARVTLKDLKDQASLYDNSAFRFRSELELDPDASQFDPESEGIEEIAQQFARTLVATIVEGF